MTPITPTPDILEVASKLVWFKEPRDAVQDPMHFLAHVMRYGTADDLVALARAGIGLDEYAKVLAGAPAGIFDRRSWTYWNLRCGKTSVPALPKRRFHDELSPLSSGDNGSAPTG